MHRLRHAERRAKAFIGVFTGVYGGLLFLGAKKKMLPRHVSERRRTGSRAS